MTQLFGFSIGHVLVGMLLESTLMFVYYEIIAWIFKHDASPLWVFTFMLALVSGGTFLALGLLWTVSK